jgi:hypothetical protein
MQRLNAFLLLMILVSLACGSGQGDVQTAIAGTKAYESHLATALAGTLAAAAPPAVAAQPTEPAPTEPAATEAPSPTPAPEATATATKAPPPAMPGALAIEYGQTVGYMPRQETIMYSFVGAQDDSVLVRVEVSNARPKMPFCDNRPMKSDFVVMNDRLVPMNPSSPGSNPTTTQIYQLPYSGRYYISATCHGGACDAFCAELDVHIEQK